jgi:hypothetical protein
MRKATAKTGERDQIRVCCFLLLPKKNRSSKEDDLSGATPLECVQYSPHLALRKLEGESSNILQEEGIEGTITIQRSTSEIQKKR